MAPSLTPAQAAAKMNRSLAGSPMRGLGSTFVAAGQANGVDPFFILAIAKVESDFGRKGFASSGGPGGRPSYNAFGLGVTGAPGAGNVYPSWAAGVSAAGANLGGSLYRGAGKVTIRDIGARWAAAPTWPTAVAGAMASLKGATITTSTVVIGQSQNINPVTGQPYPAGTFDPGDVRGSDSDFDGRFVEPVKDALGAGVGAIASLFAKLFDPSTWFRILAALGGTIAIVLGIVFLFRAQRGRGVAA